MSEQILVLKDGTLLFYDHCLNIGCKVNDLTHWNYPNEKATKRDFGKTRITVDDMQSYCAYHNEDCRIMDLGKGLRVVIPPESSRELPLMLCTFHAMQNAFRRFSKEGHEVFEEWE